MKIMFFAHDPGGANAILPLIKPFKAQGVEVIVRAKASALKILPESIEYSDDLGQINPDFLITGTSANDFTEKNLWKESKVLNIPSMAILDHWINYGIRFSQYGLKNIEKFNKNPDIFPDFIIVMDEFAKKEMVQDGVPAEIIYPLGNPHFEELVNKSKNIKNVRSKFVNTGETLITFASEPYTEDYGKGEEKTVLKDLLECVGDKNVKILVKLHPKEDFSKYGEFKNIISDKETSAIETIMASDLIVSMTSMFLIEAMILGKNIITYQPKEKNRDKFILTRQPILPFINNKEDFSKELIKNMNEIKSLNYNYSIKTRCAEDIVKFVEGKINEQKISY